MICSKKAYFEPYSAAHAIKYKTNQMGLLKSCNLTYSKLLRPFSLIFEFRFRFLKKKKHVKWTVKIFHKVIGQWHADIRL